LENNKSDLLISVIVPAYNVGSYIEDTIRSVIHQSYSNWELLIVNDGSTDNTPEKIRKFKDTRIRYFEQQNGGVSAARNLGLRQMRGKYFCFLDGDDVMPINSLNARAAILDSDPNIDFVDGVVIFCDESLAFTNRRHVPAFSGLPYEQLLRLNSDCLFGATWMIRRKKEQIYQFNESLTHAEDLYFLLTISKNGGIYAFTTEEVLWYRQRKKSAMSNYRGLEKGYRKMYSLVKHELQATPAQLRYLKLRISRIMFASYLKGQKKPFAAFRSLVQNLAQ
jgi:glycosyltransferase involved in cell wall biosynthesis